MKVACLQFAPRLGMVDDNIQRANDILNSIPSSKSFDWLILPELAFSGYNFQSLEEIKPYLEPTTAGISTIWAIERAIRHQCYVTVGYPEETTTTPVKRYNSTVTVSPSGSIIINYRKAFLYYTDETWAEEGPSGFFSGRIGHVGQVTMGICMDINPYRFAAPWDAFEFANKALHDGSRVICVSMAWLCTLSPDELLERPTEIDSATMAYWIERFHPLLKDARDVPIRVILANRCGIEKTVCYAGSTMVLHFHKGEVKLYKALGKCEESCLIVDFNEKPEYLVLGRSQS